MLLFVYLLMKCLTFGSFINSKTNKNNQIKQPN